MINFKKNKARSASGAKVVDGKLILSFPDALRPMLWQMDLAEMSSSAFEIDTGKTSGQHVLLMKKAGQPQEIAVFETMENATDALMSIGAALERSSGTSRRASGSMPPQPTGNGMQIFAGIVGIIILLVLVNVMLNMGPRPPSSLKAQLESSEATGIGAPVSADEFLRDF